MARLTAAQVDADRQARRIEELLAVAPRLDAAQRFHLARVLRPTAARLAADDRRRAA